jgi:Putative peptidoglycan binding domain
VVVVVLVAAGFGAVLAVGAFGKSGRPGSGSSADSGYRTSTATVTRGSLTSQTVVDATLGKAGMWSVVVPQSSSSSTSSSSSGSSSSSSSSSASDSGSGTFTWLPRVGRTVYQGQRIYDVSGTPVVLMYGDVPAYRDLSEGITGADVTELNTALVKMGYATRAALGPRSGWDYYSAETAYAVGQLQAKLGLTQTGTLSLGEVVFLPGPALITGWGATTVVGSPAAPGTVVLTASSTTPVVTIDLDAGQQSEVKVGDAVSVTLPDGSITQGVISQISRVASSSSGSTGESSGSPGSSSSSSSSSSTSSSNGSSGTGATITVLASLKHPEAARRLNQAPVTVTITEASVSNALSVPVDALLAQTGGGYAVEVTGPGGHHLVKVRPGLFDDAAGRVQVTGNLTLGQHVVVPGI